MRWGDPWRRQSRELVFGVGTAACSNFGQTYFISLFLVSFAGDALIAEADFGVLYAILTLGSAFLLPTFGRWMDRRGERLAFLWMGLGLVVSLGLMATAPVWWWLAAGLFGVRFLGQAGMGTLSAAAMARYFHKYRGLALGVAGLGYPLGEFVLPGLTIFLIAGWGWRSTLGVYAVVLLGAVLLGRFLVLTRALRNEEGEAWEVRERKAVARERFPWWRSPVFLWANGSSLILPFGGTVVILYLSALAREREWSLEWVGGGFALFAVVRALSGLAAGLLIDRFTGRRVYPWAVVLFVAGVGVLWGSTNAWIGLSFFVLLALAFSLGSALTALLAEEYGAEQMVEIRSVATAGSVLASALGPLMAGLLLRAGADFGVLLGIVWGLAVISAVAAFYGLRTGAWQTGKGEDKVAEL